MNVAKRGDDDSRTLDTTTKIVLIFSFYKLSKEDLESVTFLVFIAPKIDN